MRGFGIFIFLMIGSLGTAHAQEAPETYPYLEPYPSEVWFQEYIETHPMLVSKDSEQIKYLLDRIRHCDCQFIRNGEVFSGPKTAKFLRWKMMRPRWRKKVATAEDFVEVITPASITTGKAYYVIYPDQGRHKLIEIMRQELAFLSKNITLYQ